MKNLIDKWLKEIKCKHEYVYQARSYQKKISKSQTPFRYTVEWIDLKCEKCGKKKTRTYEWCEMKGIRPYPPLNTGPGRRKGVVERS